MVLGCRYSLLWPIWVGTRIGHIFLEIVTSMAAESVDEFEPLAAKATDSMGRVFVDVPGSTLRALRRTSCEDECRDSDHAQDDSAADNPNKGTHCFD
jgi:hypothetical protein